MNNLLLPLIWFLYVCDIVGAQNTITTDATVLNNQKKQGDRVQDLSGFNHAKIFRYLEVTRKSLPGHILVSWDIEDSYSSRDIQYFIITEYLKDGDCIATNDPDVHETLLDNQVRSYELRAARAWSYLSVTLKGVDQINNQTDHITKSIITHERAPSGTVENIAATSIQSNSAQLTWDPPACRHRGGALKHYDVEVTPAESPIEMWTTKSFTNGISLTALKPFSGFNVRVRFTNKQGEGAWSPPYAFQTSQGVPGAPMILYNFTYDDISIGLFIGPPVQANGKIDQYHVEMRGGSSGLSHLYTPVNGTEYVIASISPNTTYKFKARAHNTAGWGHWSREIEVRTKEEIKPIPVALRQTAANTTCIRFQWAAPPSAEDMVYKFKILVTTNDEKKTNHTAYVSKGTHSHEQCGLARYTQYTVAVAITRDTGQTGHAIATRMWTEGLAPPQPRPPVVVKTTRTTITLEIYPVMFDFGPLTGYELRVLEVFHNHTIKLPHPISTEHHDNSEYVPLSFLKPVGSSGFDGNSKGHPHIQPMTRKKTRSVHIDDRIDYNSLYKPVNFRRNLTQHPFLVVLNTTNTNVDRATRFHTWKWLWLKELRKFKSVNLFNRSHQSLPDSFNDTERNKNTSNRLIVAYGQRNYTQRLKGVSAISHIEKSTRKPLQQEPGQKQLNLPVDPIGNHSEVKDTDNDKRSWVKENRTLDDISKVISMQGKPISRQKRSFRNPPGVLWLEMLSNEVTERTWITLGDGKGVRNQPNIPLEPGHEYAIVFVVKSTVVDVTKHSYVFASTTAFTLPPEPQGIISKSTALYITLPICGALFLLLGFFVIRHVVKKKGEEREHENERDTESDDGKISHSSTDASDDDDNFINDDDSIVDGDNDNGADMKRSLTKKDKTKKGIDELENCFNKTNSLTEPRYITTMRDNVMYEHDSGFNNNCRDNNGNNSAHCIVDVPCEAARIDINATHDLNDTVLHEQKSKKKHKGNRDVNHVHEKNASSTQEADVYNSEIKNLNLCENDLKNPENIDEYSFILGNFDDSPHCNDSYKSIGQHKYAGSAWSNHDYNKDAIAKSAYYGVTPGYKHNTDIRAGSPTSSPSTISTHSNYSCTCSNRPSSSDSCCCGEKSSSDISCSKSPFLENADTNGCTDGANMSSTLPFSSNKKEVPFSKKKKREESRQSVDLTTSINSTSGRPRVLALEKSNTSSSKPAQKSPYIANCSPSNLNGASKNTSIDPDKSSESSLETISLSTFSLTENQDRKHCSCGPSCAKGCVFDKYKKVKEVKNKRKANKSHVAEENICDGANIDAVSIERGSNNNSIHHRSYTPHSDGEYLNKNNNAILPDSWYAETTKIDILCFDEDNETTGFATTSQRYFVETIQQRDVMQDGIVNMHNVPRCINEEEHSKCECRENKNMHHSHGKNIQCVDNNEDINGVNDDDSNDDDTCENAGGDNNDDNYDNDDTNNDNDDDGNDDCDFGNGDKDNIDEDNNDNSDDNGDDDNDHDDDEDDGNSDDDGNDVGNDENDNDEDREEDDFNNNDDSKDNYDDNNNNDDVGNHESNIYGDNYDDDYNNNNNGADNGDAGSDGVDLDGDTKEDEDEDNNDNNSGNGDDDKGGNENECCRDDDYADGNNNEYHDDRQKKEVNFTVDNYVINYNELLYMEWDKYHSANEVCGENNAYREEIRQVYQLQGKVIKKHEGSLDLMENGNERENCFDNRFSKRQCYPHLCHNNTTFMHFCSLVENNGGESTNINNNAGGPETKSILKIRRGTEERDGGDDNVNVNNCESEGETDSDSSGKEENKKEKTPVAGEQHSSDSESERENDSASDNDCKVKETTILDSSKEHSKVTSCKQSEDSKGKKKKNRRASFMSGLFRSKHSQEKATPSDMENEHSGDVSQEGEKTCQNKTDNQSKTEERTASVSKSQRKRFSFRLRRSRRHTLEVEDTHEKGEKSKKTKNGPTSKDDDNKQNTSTEENPEDGHTKIGAKTRSRQVRFLRRRQTLLESTTEYLPDPNVTGVWNNNDVPKKMSKHKIARRKNNNRSNLTTASSKPRNRNMKHSNAATSSRVTQGRDGSTLRTSWRHKLGIGNSRNDPETAIDNLPTQGAPAVFRLSDSRLYNRSNCADIENAFSDQGYSRRWPWSNFKLKRHRGKRENSPGTSNLPFPAAYNLAGVSSCGNAFVSGRPCQDIHGGTLYGPQSSVHLLDNADARYSRTTSKSFLKSAQATRKSTFKSRPAKSKDNNSSNLIDPDTERASSNRLSRYSREHNHHSSRIKRLLRSNQKQLRFKDEFRILEKYKKKQLKTLRFDVARANLYKNRFPTILPPDHSRVIVERVSPAESDYYNACHITNLGGQTDYIAAQTPICPSSVADFWRLVLLHRVETVVLLCNCIENGVIKSQQYWADAGVFVGGEMLVETLETHMFADFVIRVLKVTTKGMDEHFLTHFQFLSWPPEGVPEDPFPLLELRYHVRYRHGNSPSPMLVQCSTSVSRTSVFIAVDSLIQQYGNEGYANVYQLVKRMRSAQPFSVRTFKQYLLIYETLFEEFQAGDTVLQGNFRHRYRQLCERNPNSGSSFLVDQYKMLERFTPPLTVEECSAAFKQENRHKNAYMDIVPPDWYRPVLNNSVNGEPPSGYINAVFVDGLIRRSEFIVTQAPLTSSVFDFWRMIFDYQVQTIVKLGACRGKNRERFYPQTGGRQFGYISVEHVNKVQVGVAYVSSLKMCVCTVNGAEKMAVRLFEVDKWSDDDSDLSLPRIESTPDSKTDLLQLIDSVMDWQMLANRRTSPIVVVDKDGASISGVFCACALICERMRINREVDVYHTVKHIKRRRPQFISSFEQYRYLHHVLWEYYNDYIILHEERIQSIEQHPQNADDITSVTASESEHSVVNRNTPNVEIWPCSSDNSVHEYNDPEYGTVDEKKGMYYGDHVNDDEFSIKEETKEGIISAVQEACAEFRKKDCKKEIYDSQPDSISRNDCGCPDKDTTKPDHPQLIYDTKYSYCRESSYARHSPMSKGFEESFKQEISTTENKCSVSHTRRRFNADPCQANCVPRLERADSVCSQRSRQSELIDEVTNLINKTKKSNVASKNPPYYDRETEMYRRGSLIDKETEMSRNGSLINRSTEISSRNSSTHKEMLMHSAGSFMDSKTKLSKRGSLDGSKTTVTRQGSSIGSRGNIGKRDSVTSQKSNRLSDLVKTESKVRYDDSNQLETSSPSYIKEHYNHNGENFYKARTSERMNRKESFTSQGKGSYSNYESRRYSNLSLQDKDDHNLHGSGVGGAKTEASVSIEETQQGVRHGDGLSADSFSQEESAPNTTKDGYTRNKRLNKGSPPSGHKDTHEHGNVNGRKPLYSQEGVDANVPAPLSTSIKSLHRHSDEKKQSHVSILHQHKTSDDNNTLHSSNSVGRRSTTRVCSGSFSRVSANNDIQIANRIAVGESDQDQKWSSGNNDRARQSWIGKFEDTSFENGERKTSGVFGAMSNAGEDGFNGNSKHIVQDKLQGNMYRDFNVADESYYGNASPRRESFSTFRKNSHGGNNSQRQQLATTECNDWDNDDDDDDEEDVIGIAERRAPSSGINIEYETVYKGWRTPPRQVTRPSAGASESMTSRVTFASVAAFEGAKTCDGLDDLENSSLNVTESKQNIHKLDVDAELRSLSSEYDISIIENKE